ncbi:Heat shock protein hsp-1, partial [Dispira simplex]
MLSNCFASTLLQDMCGVMSHVEPLYHYPGPSYWGMAPRSMSLWETSYNRLARMARAPTYVITTSTYAPTEPCGNNEEAQAQNDQGETKNSPQAADSTTAASTEDAQSAAKNTDTCATTHRLPVGKSQRLLSPMALYDLSGYFSLRPFVDQMFGELDHVFSADSERKPNFMRANVRSRVIEHDRNYSLEVEVPGFAKNEVQLHWDDATQSLRIKGESRQSLVSPE